MPQLIFEQADAAGRPFGPPLIGEAPGRFGGEDIRDPEQVRRSQSLDQLEGVEWPPPEYDSHLTGACHRLRSKPIGDYAVEDLRVMSGQSIGLRFLVPIAIEVVAQEPLAQGDLYPGDLLCSLLRSDPGFWRGAPHLRKTLDSMVNHFDDVPAEVAEDLLEWRRWTAT